MDQKLSDAGISQETQAGDIAIAEKVRDIVCDAAGIASGPLGILAGGICWMKNLEDVDLGEVQSKVDNAINDYFPSWFKSLWESLIQLGERGEGVRGG